MDCVRQNASGTIPSNLYEIGSIIQTDEYPPFTKKLTVCGITLIARDDVSDVFMMRVGQTIGEMFSIPEWKGALKQQHFLKNLYTYQTVTFSFYCEYYPLRSIKLLNPQFLGLFIEEFERKIQG